MTRTRKTLIIIGGHEDKKNEKLILREIANRIGEGKLVITTVASSQPEGTFEEYERIFRRLGVRHIANLGIDTREEALNGSREKILEDARGVFFTGGDQLKITSQIGDTPIFQRVHDIYDRGGVIAGTSAGASVMCETMLVSGDGASHKVRDNLRMAPGLGLVDGIVIDQHFAERGRMGRLVAAVAQNPRNIGVGIDEDTAIIVEGGHRFTVIGSGAVYVVDGAEVTFSNLIEEEFDRMLSTFDIRMHVLSQGDEFDLRKRRPREHPAEKIEQEIMKDR
jgi:cyanophycinase